eukprot:1186241-Prorocentrum_minimum.AAC.1
MDHRVGLEIKEQQRPPCLAANIRIYVLQGRLNSLIANNQQQKKNKRKERDQSAERTTRKRAKNLGGVNIPTPALKRREKSYSK